MSYFIGIPVSSRLREELRRHTERLSIRPAGIRWEKPEKYHITLFYFGHVAPGRDAAMREAFAECANADLGEIAIAGIGVFPNGRRARVLWAGVGEHGGLSALQARVAASAGERGFKVEERPYHPHVTLGRFTTRKGFPAAGFLADAQRSFGTFVPARLVLYESAGGEYREVLCIE